MARAARDAGFEVHVACRVDRHGDRIVAEGFALHSLDWRREERSPLGLVQETLAIRRLLRQLRPALVHQVAIKPTVLGSLASTGLALPTVNSVAGLGYGFMARGGKAWLLRSAMTGLFRWILNRPRTATVVQNRDDLAAVASLGVRADRLRQIPGSGLPLEDFPVQPEPPEPVRFGFVARMLRDKGIEPLAAAFAALRARHADSTLVLAGDIDTANPASLDATEMAALARQSGIDWRGHVTDVREVWRDCHVAVLPSRREGLPRALLEAAASGRPLIATDVPGCRELVRDGVNGLLVPFGDEAALAGAMDRLAGDPALRARLGAAARRDVEETYSAASVGAAIVDTYRSVLG